MKILKKSLKWGLYFLLIPILYIIVALILSNISVDRKMESQASDKSIYINTNGVHLDIILPKENINSSLLANLKHNSREKYLSFGWGDENFYLNTPTWGDLTFKNAFGALFLKSTTVMHITRYKQKRSDWIEIKVHQSELQKLNTYIQNTFQVDENGHKIILEGQGYFTKDDFYKAKGSYSCFKTCNTWVNSALKESELKSCVWTPFDFGLLNKYE